MDKSKHITIEITTHELEVLCLALYKTSKHGQFPTWYDLKSNDVVNGKNLLEKLLEILSKAKGDTDGYEVELTDN